MANQIQLSAQDVVVLTKQAKGDKQRPRGEAWSLASRCSARLASHAEGKLSLASDVRLPLTAVVSQLWKVRGIALAQWKAAQAAEAEAAPQEVPSKLDAAIERFVAR